MRDYRGKRVDNGEWVYGWYVQCFLSWIVPQLNVDRFDFVQVIPETVGQDIGIKNKQSVKVYEGDIVKGGRSVNENAIEQREVIYCEKEASFLLREIGLSHPTRIPIYYMTNLEVIGNIHDNPKLMQC